MRTERVGDATLYTGDVMAVLATLPDESVHCVVTSPPYWGLRDYGVPGQIGLESSPEEYVARMVAVFREVRRVLRKDGTCWCNLGDAYWSDGKRGSGGVNEWSKAKRSEGQWLEHDTKTDLPLKPKDLVGIPWMLAFALRADGWYLRSDIIWAKPNPMPESVTDRPTKAHEYLFLLSKSARYFYDAEAVREEVTQTTLDRLAQPNFDNQKGGPKDLGNGNRSERRTLENLKERYSKEGVWTDRHAGYAETARPGRNRRTVWTIATEPYPLAHFATFPRKLVQPCILAGCPEHACPKCGAPWEREVERVRVDGNGREISGSWHGDDQQSAVHGGPGAFNRTTILGEHPTCACGLPAIGGTVLDPFGGSGTTAEVALEYGRRAILIELKPEYVELQKRRLAPVAGRPMLDFAGAPHA